LKIVELENHREVDSVTLEGDALAVSHGLSRNGISELALEQWYRAEAARLINERVDRLSSQMGIHCKRIVIRG